MHKTDVLIIGGGPAGSSCAWSLKRSGVDCMILDRQAFPRVKLCAGWVPPAVWHDLMIEPEEYPYGLTTYPRLHISILGIQVAVPTVQYAIRRFEFDNWLLERADVPIMKHNVRKIEKVSKGYLVDGIYETSLIVGAGGTNCPVYRTIFQEQCPRNKADLIVALEEEFPYPVKDERCQLWFGENNLPGYAWYVPKAGGYVNVGVGGKANKLKEKGDTIQRHWAHLVDKLKQKDIITGYEYHPKGHSYYLRQSNMPVQLNGIYLVGDAAALATRDLGEGIDVAIKSGVRAAESIVNGQPYFVDDIRKRTLGYEWVKLPWLMHKN